MMVMRIKMRITIIDSMPMIVIASTITMAMIIIITTTSTPPTVVAISKRMRGPRATLAI